MKTYDLTGQQLQQIANLCKQEQGSVDGARAEASLMLNLLETNYTKYGDDVIAFIIGSKWFSKAEYWMQNGNAGSAYVDAVRDVMCRGHRVFPLGINEHDCFSDIVSVMNGSQDVTDRKRDRSVYIKNVTRIRNRYGSTYTFWCFPTLTADPFGYTDSNKKYMTEDETMVTRTTILAQARTWLGRNEADGSHKEIINVYNAHGPLARGYKVQYDDAWCATFVSAVAIKCGAENIIPLECGCEEMIQKAKAMGIWVEDDSYTPLPADIIMYDWQDSGSGDCTGYADHVGFVEKVQGGAQTVIEGNRYDSVSRRSLPVNGQFIRGYIVPKYASEVTEAPQTDDEPTRVEQFTVTIRSLKKGDNGPDVLILEEVLKSRGYYKGSLDMHFGDLLDAAVRAYQADRIKDGVMIGGDDGKPDGVCGYGTWSDLLALLLTRV